MPIAIQDIIHIAFPAVVHEMCSGYKWVGRGMRCKEAHGRIKTYGILGTRVEQPMEAANGRITSISYPIRELRTPIVWTAMDSLRLSTESSRISFTQTTLKLAIKAHDRALLRKIGRGTLVVSDTAKYKLGDLQLLNNGNFVYNIFTAYAVIDPSLHG